MVPSAPFLVAAVVLLLACAGRTAVAQSQDGSFFTNATCGVPASFSSLRGITADIASVQIVSGCGSEPTAVAVSVMLLDHDFATYAVGGNMAVSVTISHSPSGIESELRMTQQVQRVIRWQPAPTEAPTTTTTVAPTPQPTAAPLPVNASLSNATTAAPTTATAAPLATAATPAPTLSSILTFSSAVATAAVTQSVVFTNIAPLTTFGAYQVTVHVSGQVVALPSGAIAVLRDSNETTCSAAVTQLPTLTTFPDTSSELQAIGSGAEAYGLVRAQIGSLHYDILRTFSCAVLVNGRATPLVVTNNVSFFEIRVGVSLSSFTLLLDASCSARDEFQNQTSTLLPPSLSSTRSVAFIFPLLAPAPTFEVSSSPEQYEVGVDNDDVFFSPVMVRPVPRTTVANATTFFMLIRGDVPLVESPPATSWSAFTASASLGVAIAGVRVAETSQMLAYTVAPGSQPSLISRRVLLLPAGTASWKYTLMGVLLGLVAVAYYIIVIQALVAGELRKYRRKQQRLEDEKARKEAGVVPQATRGDRNSDDTSSSATNDAAAEDEEELGMPPRPLRIVSYLAYVLNDLAIVITDISFAVSCFAYPGVNVIYKVMYPFIMIVFVLLIVRRWHWATRKFEKDDRDRDDDEDSDDSAGGDNKSANDDDAAAGRGWLSCCQTLRYMVFAPLGNVITAPVYVQDIDMVDGTQKAREFWGGVTRWVIDLPTFIVVLSFVANNPTRTTDGSLFKLFLCIASFVFGMRGMFQAGRLAVMELYRFWFGDAEKEERRRARRRRREREAKEREAKELDAAAQQSSPDAAAQGDDADGEKRVDGTEVTAAAAADDDVSAEPSWKREPTAAADPLEDDATVRSGTDRTTGAQHRRRTSVGGSGSVRHSRNPSVQTADPATADLASTTAQQRRAAAARDPYTTSTPPAAAASAAHQQQGAAQPQRRRDLRQERPAPLRAVEPAVEEQPSERARQPRQNAEPAPAPPPMDELPWGEEEEAADGSGAAGAGWNPIAQAPSQTPPSEPVPAAADGYADEEAAAIEREIAAVERLRLLRRQLADEGSAAVDGSAAPAAAGAGADSSRPWSDQPQLQQRPASALSSPHRIKPRDTHVSFPEDGARAPVAQPDGGDGRQLDYGPAPGEEDDDDAAGVTDRTYDFAAGAPYAAAEDDKWRAAPQSPGGGGGNDESLDRPGAGGEFDGDEFSV